MVTFNKKNWIDGTSVFNAYEGNRIEQGILDIINGADATTATLVNDATPSATRVALDARYLAGSVGIAGLPAGAVVYSAGTTRPTTRTDLVCFFTGTADPGANALAGDIWLKSP